MNFQICRLDAHYHFNNIYYHLFLILLVAPLLLCREKIISRTWKYKKQYLLQQVERAVLAYCVVAMLRTENNV